MKMLLQKLREAGLNQTQKEAIVDLCLLGMYIDKQLSLAEQDFVDDEADQSDWESGISFSSYLQRTISKVRAASEPQKQAAFLQGIRDRLDSQTSRATAIAELEVLFSTDNMVQVEAEFLSQVKQLLND